MKVESFKLVAVGFIAGLLTQNLMAETLSLKPGSSLICPAKGDVVRCDDVPTCTLKKRFVGNSWMVFLPNGKEHGDFDTEEEARTELKKLFDIKVCEKTKYIKE